MSLNKLIVVDCDGVLLNWSEGFHAFMDRHGYKRLEGVSQDSYSLSPLYGLEVANTKQLIRQFNESAAIGFLKPYDEDTVEYVNTLKKLGYRFEVVTSLGDWEYSIALRKYNLECVFGQGVFDEIFCLPIGDPKYDFLASRYGENSGAFWVEDKAENAEDGAKLGMKTYLMHCSHNIDFDFRYPITRVLNWEEIYHDITD